MCSSSRAPWCDVSLRSAPPRRKSRNRIAPITRIEQGLSGSIDGRKCRSRHGRESRPFDAAFVGSNRNVFIRGIRIDSSMRLERAMRASKTQ